MALFNPYSGGPKNKPEPHIHRNPWIALNMASGIAREHSHVNLAQHGGLVQLINWPKQRTSLILENPVMINLHLSSQGICWPVTRLCSWRSGVFFLSWLTTKYWFFDWNAGSSQINCDHGRVVSKPIIANSGWKVNQNVDFSCTKKRFFTAYVLSSLRTFKLRRPNIINRKPPLQLQELNKFSLIWG